MEEWYKNVVGIDVTTYLVSKGKVTGMPIMSVRSLHPLPNGYGVWAKTHYGKQVFVSPETADELRPLLNFFNDKKKRA